MGLSRYEKIETDLAALKADIAKTPTFRRFEFEPNSEWQQIELQFGEMWDRVVPYSSLLRVSNNDYAILDYINNGRVSAGLKPFDTKTTRVSTGSYSTGNGCVLSITVYIGFDLKTFCEAAGYPYRIVHDESEAPPLSLKNPKSLFCRMGMHHYEREPGMLEYVRRDDAGLSGFFNAFFGYWGIQNGVQTGIRRCMRCGHRQFVKRTGTFPVSGTASKWKPIDQTEWNRIKDLGKVSI